MAESADQVDLFVFIDMFVPQLHNASSGGLENYILVQAKT